MSQNNEIQQIEFLTFWITFMIVKTFKINSSQLLDEFFYGSDFFPHDSNKLKVSI